MAVGAPAHVSSAAPGGVYPQDRRLMSSGERRGHLSADLAVWVGAAGPWELPPSLPDRAGGLRRR
jgi:hypothetical protein